MDSNKGLKIARNNPVMVMVIIDLKLIDLNNIYYISFDEKSLFMPFFKVFICYYQL